MVANYTHILKRAIFPKSSTMTCVYLQSYLKYQSNEDSKLAAEAAVSTGRITWNEHARLRPVELGCAFAVSSVTEALRERVDMIQ